MTYTNINRHSFVYFHNGRVQRKKITEREGNVKLYRSCSVYTFVRCSTTLRAHFLVRTLLLASAVHSSRSHSATARPCFL